jgi:hypothetical protein
VDEQFFPLAECLFLNALIEIKRRRVSERMPQVSETERSTEHDSVMPDDNLLSYSGRSDPKESTTTSS